MNKEKIRLEIPKNVRTLLNTLKSRGYEAFAVGGCVRDSLLSVQPHDWDICTNAEPEKTKECFSGYRMFEAGIKHGTISVVLDGEVYEITTYRIDGEYSDNRRPDSVSFTGDIRQDLARRDFTVNAMAYNDESGIVDPFGGVQDLKSGLIRCVGNAEKRFDEDALRILRALRFASTYSFEIEDSTSRAIIAKKALLHNIAAERISSELARLLCGDGVEKILNDYREVFAEFMPEIRDSFDFEQRSKHHCLDVWRHTVRAVSVVEPEPLLRMSMLLHDLGKPAACTTDPDGTRHFKGHPKISVELAKPILSRLRFSSAFCEDCLKLVEYHDIRFSGKRPQLRRVIRDIGEENTKRLFKLQYADTMAQSDYMREEKLSALEAEKQLFEELMSESECFSLKQLAVNGNDIKALGFSGKEIGLVLDALLQEVLDEKIKNEKTALLHKAKNIKNRTTG